MNKCWEKCNFYTHPYEISVIVENDFMTTTLVESEDFIGRWIILYTQLSNTASLYKYTKHLVCVNKVYKNKTIESVIHRHLHIKNYDIYGVLTKHQILFYTSLPFYQFYE